MHDPDPDAQRFRDYAEGSSNDSPLDLSGREGAPRTYYMPRHTKATTVYCPFCGTIDSGEICMDTDSRAKFYWIQCSKCEACGPTDYDPQTAEDLWNRRRTEGEDER